ncbi:MAG: hypothetical protein HXK84_00640 [Lachnospiraceae bacterium]|nr:hypothetical protein [Lachnospiraceae bacterium]
MKRYEYTDEQLNITLPDGTKLKEYFADGLITVPDQIFDENYKILPLGVRNESHTKIAMNHGYVNTLKGRDHAESEEYRHRGYKTMEINRARKKSFREAIEAAIYSKAASKTREKYRLDEDATILDGVIAAMIEASDKGNVRAAEFMRDTVGEKPVERTEISASLITEADRALMDKLQEIHYKESRRDREGKAKEEDI